MAKTSVSCSVVTAALIRQLSHELNRPAAELLHEWAMREIKRLALKPAAEEAVAEVPDGIKGKVVLKMCGAEIIATADYARQFAKLLDGYASGELKGKHVDLDIGHGMLIERRGNGVVVMDIVTKEETSMSSGAARMFAEQIIETADQA